MRVLTYIPCKVLDEQGYVYAYIWCVYIYIMCVDIYYICIIYNRQSTNSNKTSSTYLHIRTLYSLSHTHIYIYKYISTLIRTYICCTYIYIYDHIHIYIYMHTYNPYMYTFSLSLSVHRSVSGRYALTMALCSRAGALHLCAPLSRGLRTSGLL